MESRTVVEAICRLPLDYAAGELSPRDLVQRSGYLLARADVSRGAIEVCLEQHPDWMDAWFAWSDDKRYSPAWWIRDAGPRAYQVGYYDPGIDSQPRPLVFDTKARACAEIVIRDVESIAERIDGGDPHHVTFGDAD
jgi:hypothetical protein